MLARAAAALPELPAARERRYIETLSLTPETARLFAWRAELADYFDAVCASDQSLESQVAANWVTELQGRLGDEEAEDSKVSAAALAQLAAMVVSSQINQGGAKQVLDQLVTAGGEPASIVADQGLEAVGGADELAPIVAAALEANPELTERLRGGDMKPIGVIVGEVMKETRGRADGKEVTALVRQQLGLG
jgi:aspartyl-tRNA(Asn)/glutamyl-tRNA(Gln) amidotransferase subunit B